MVEFLDNFNIKEAEELEYVKFERFKLIKKIGKVLSFILFAGLILGLFIVNR